MLSAAFWPCPPGFKYCDKTLGTIISALVPYVFTAAAMIALLFLVMGGLRYMLARGDPKAAEAARSTATNAVIGLLIILFAATIYFLVAQMFKIEIFGAFPLVKPAYAAGEVDICKQVKLGNVPICEAFPSLGYFFTRVVLVALVVAGVVFLAMTVWGGFQYLNAGGDPKIANAARQTLTNAGIGLLIIIFSFFIIEVLTHVAGIKSIFSP